MQVVQSGSRWGLGRMRGVLGQMQGKTCLEGAAGKRKIPPKDNQRNGVKSSTISCLGT